MPQLLLLRAAPSSLMYVHPSILAYPRFIPAPSFHPRSILAHVCAPLPRRLAQRTSPPLLLCTLCVAHSVLTPPRSFVVPCILGFVQQLKHLAFKVCAGLTMRLCVCAESLVAMQLLVAAAAPIPRLVCSSQAAAKQHVLGCVLLPPQLLSYLPVLDLSLPVPPSLHLR